MAGAAAAAWGLVGIAVVLLRAIWSLAPPAAAALGASDLTVLDWLLAGIFIAFMAYFEGYRGFQRGFAPRVVARAVCLGRDPRPLHALLAPAYCVGLFHASRRRVLASWLLVGMIVGLVVAVRLLPQPYRGIVDAGVVAGLGWGTAALGWFSLGALAGRPPETSPDLPG